jgi:4-methyl-5(b-hydroxyethyl)-thiazole monophosphate biosynthesis
MPDVLVLLADGFEEVEAMTIVDILRRAGINVVIAGLHEGHVESARRVKILPDTTIDKVRSGDFDMIVLPGGQPGSDNLNADDRVIRLVRDFHAKGKLTGAICAAPFVLASAGILDGRRVTAYPSYKEKLGKAIYREENVVEDQNLMTSRGPGTAHCFALAIVERLLGKEKSASIKEAMLLQNCE